MWNPDFPRGPSLCRFCGEGMETQEQLDYLYLFGRDEPQGFHFGKPQPAARFIDILKTYIGAPRAAGAAGAS